MAASKHDCPHCRCKVYKTRICKREQCPVSFIPKDNRQVYCTRKCNERDKQARFRAKRAVTCPVTPKT